MRRVTAFGFAPLVVVVLGLAATACPRSDRCAAVDKAPKETVVARCVPLACPEGSKPDGAGGCVCTDGQPAFFGACMGAEALPSYCGVAARPAAGGCAPVPCSTSYVLDRASGVCLPVGSQRALAKQIGVGLYDDETLGCDAEGSHLLVRASTAACAPVTDACERGERAEKGACTPLPACSAGTLWSAIDDRCARVVTALDDRPLVDVAQWMRAAFGADGGAGTTAICAPLRADKRFGTTTEDDVIVTLELRMRANEIGEAELRIEAISAGAPSDTARAVVERGVRPVLGALRALGGVANAASASTRVHCPIHLWARPRAERIEAGDAGASH